MNNGKIWLVVKPTVGLPAFLGGVTIIALCVHAAVLSNAGWYKQYYNGKAAPKTAAVTQPAEPGAPLAAPVAAAQAADTSVVLAQHSPPARK